MQEIVSKLQILIIATHDLNTARTLCNRGVILSHGNLVADMEIGEALSAYHASAAAERQHASSQFVAQFA
jgi:ABC-type polysaccharide/polyol phosphate transport system ATPase subunit